jgi:hypothetical protein
MKRTAFALLALMMGASLAVAQNNSQIFGKASDASGAVLPGVTVTLSGPVLLQPRVAVTSETGTYQFPGLAIGTYAVRFELAGFTAVVKSGIQLQGSFNAQINADLQIATLNEDVIVTGASPIIDIRSTTQGARFNVDELQALPTGRDIFSMFDKAPSVMVATQNVGGSNLGQQNTMISRGAAGGQTRSFSDGMDMGTGGNLPTYLDFDSFDEVQINTGGADVSMQTPGVLINMITKSGSDRFKGSVRGFLTDQRFEGNNVSDEQRARGTSAGSPILNIKDYGFEVGGPIRKGRAWFWGGLSRQEVQVGANNYFKKSGDCGALAAAPLSFPIGDVRKCLEPVSNDLRHVNYKVTVQPFKNNQFSFRNSYDLKLQTNRGASDLVPASATTRLTTVPDSMGPKFWTTGWPPFWRIGDQHTFSDRFMMEVAYGRFCACTYIGFADDSLSTVQPAFEVATGMQDRSATDNINFIIRNNVDAIANYFLPGVLGGDHSLRGGYKYFYYPGVVSAHVGGNVTARFNSGRTLPAFTTPFSATFSRDNYREQFLSQHTMYFQDTYTRGRLTLIAGFRFDRQDDWQGAATVPGSPFQGQTTMNGGVFNFLPAVEFPGIKGMPIWNNFAPRLGVTWDLSGDGKTVVKGSYAQFYDQRTPGQISGFLSTIGANTIELPWQDLNGDKFVQAGEVDSSRILAFSAGFDPTNPGLRTSPNRVDPNIKNPKTDEIVIGINKELPGQIGVSASYVWRSYANFTWSDRIGVTSASFTQTTLTPPAASCPAGARCETVTYWVPNAPLPAALMLSNQPDQFRKFNGMELSVRKRLSSRWMLNGSFAYNSTVVKYDSPDSFEDPTNIAQQHNAQYAPGVATGGADAANPNAKWVTRYQGSYRLPWYEIGLAATVDLRQGYPLLPSINVASRPNSGGAVQVLLDSVGEVRLPVFSSTDFRVDKSVSFGSRKLLATLDVFNLFNAGTDLARRVVQNAANANLVSQILAPRVARFGLSLTF